MLILGRKIGERIRISDDIIVEVVSIRGGKVRLAITAPVDVPIYREEVYLQRQKAKGLANGSV
jgi:carbon storage regulator